MQDDVVTIQYLLPHFAQLLELRGILFPALVHPKVLQSTPLNLVELRNDILNISQLLEQRWLLILRRVLLHTEIHIMREYEVVQCGNVLHVLQQLLLYDTLL
jgi:hypothetical protein